MGTKKKVAKQLTKVSKATKALVSLLAPPTPEEGFDFVTDEQIEGGVAVLEAVAAQTLPKGRKAPSVKKIASDIWTARKMEGIADFENFYRCGLGLDVESTGTFERFNSWIYEEGHRLARRYGCPDVFGLNGTEKLSLPKMPNEHRLIVKQALNMSPDKPHGDEITQLVIRIISTGELLYSKFFKPRVPFHPVAKVIAEQAGVLAGIESPDVGVWGDEAETIGTLLKDRLVVAWNSPFDRRLIEQTNSIHAIGGETVGARQRYERVGPTMRVVTYFGANWGDAMASYGAATGASNYTKQSAAVERLGLVIEGEAHHAETDTLALCKIVQAIFKGSPGPMW